tara:strand:+ start:2696 stop:3142 length:447 start_codon:yes stop_codon:yes gene_type:complete
MARILQHDESSLIYPVGVAGTSSNPVYVGGRFSISISDSVSATVLNGTTAVYVMANNSNPSSTTPGGDQGTPDAGYSGNYTENTDFASRWTSIGNLVSFTGGAGTFIHYDKPVRYIALSAESSAALAQCFSGSLSGFVFSDYSACKTH